MVVSSKDVTEQVNKGKRGSTAINSFLNNEIEILRKAIDSKALSSKRA